MSVPSSEQSSEIPIVILFIFGCTGSLLVLGLLSSCSAHASHCGGFSCCGAWAVGCRLNSCV